MGALLDCFKGSSSKESYTQRPEPSLESERTPLLSHIPPPPRAPAASARPRSLTEELTDVLDDREPDLTSIDIQVLGIPEIDKQFQDHAALYNEYLSRYSELLDCMYKLDGKRDDNFRGVQSFLTKLRSEMSAEGLKRMKPIRRYQFCMELNYEGHYFNEDTNVVLQKFNRANRIIKELLDKKKPMIDSVDLVLESEERIKRDVFVHCTDSRFNGQGPEFWRICLNNLKLLRRITPAARYIARIANQSFEELVKGAGILCQEARVDE